MKQKGGVKPFQLRNSKICDLDLEKITKSAYEGVISNAGSRFADGLRFQT